MLTRRRFLGCAVGVAGGALVMALPGELGALESDERPARASAARVQCALVDLGEHCSLRESLTGYESALAALGATWTRVDARSLADCALLIVPAAMRIPPSIARQLMARARGGSTVIVESGAGFCDAGDADFLAHRDVLREVLHLHIASPVSLWPRSASARGIPYVDYSWPSAVAVRDFSRVVPLGTATRGDEIIARVAGVPVALRRRVGSGRLVFLGSPLGPTLAAGDSEAQRWLAQVVSGGPNSDIR